MRISLNLASRPYIALEPYFRRLRFWAIVLAVLAVPLAFGLRVESRRAAAARADEDRTLSAIDKFEQQRQNSRAQMQQPANAAVLTQSQFLNALFQQKAFSWTAVMMDLENILPTGLQVQAIEPETAKDGTVTIRLRVNGPRDRAVTLVRNLEHSRRFLSPRLAGETAEAGAQAGQMNAFHPVSASSGVNFDILAEYNPLGSTAQEASHQRENKQAQPALKATTPVNQPVKARHSKALARPADKHQGVRP